MNMSSTIGYFCSAFARNGMSTEAWLAWMFLQATLIVIGEACGYYPLRIVRLIHMGNTAGGVGR
jgi:hypothetical protein